MIARSSTWIKWSLICLFLGWVFSMIGIFYVVQKPFSLATLQSLIQNDGPPFTFSAAALGRTLLDLLAGLWLYLLSLGLGLWLYRWLAMEKTAKSDLATLEKIIFSSALGFGALGLLVFFLGLAGFITPANLYTITILLTLLVAPQTLKTLHRTRLPSPPLLLKLYLPLTIGLALTIALLPPTDWDGLFYHLTGPKLYLAAGRIIPGIDIPHLNFPFLFEMLFMLALVIRGAVTAKLLHFVFSLLLAGLVYLTAKQHLNLKNGWWAVIFLFSMPMVLTLAGWAHNDLALAFYQVAALYALLGYRGTDKPSDAEGQTRWLILSGLFCGLAMGLKYTSFVTPLTLVGLLLWGQWRERTSFVQVLKSIIVFAVSTLLVAGPWYLKNWFFTGNPVYPFVFAGRFWDDFRSAAYSGAGSGIGLDPLALITLPYQLTLGLQDANYVDGRSGPLFLALLPLILIYSLFRYHSPFPKAFNALLTFALVQYLFWTLGIIWSHGLWQSRLLLSAFVALCPVLAWILHDLRHLNHPKFSLQHFLKLLIGLILIFGLIDQIMYDYHRTGWLFYRPWTYLIGSETEEAYLTRRLGAHYAAMAEINTQFPADAVVVFLWEPRSYYCQVDCRPDSILDEYGHLQYLYGQDAEAIAQAWHKKGVTHVLVHRMGYDVLREADKIPPEVRPDPQVLNALEAEHLELIFDVVGAYQGYKLK